MLTCVPSCCCRVQLKWALQWSVQWRPHVRERSEWSGVESAALSVWYAAPLFGAPSSDSAPATAPGSSHCIFFFCFFFGEPRIRQEQQSCVNNKKQQTMQMLRKFCINKKYSQIKSVEKTELLRSPKWIKAIFGQASLVEISRKYA